MQDFQAITHQRQPKGMFHAIVVMFKRLLGVKRRINVDTFDLSRELLLKRLQRQKVVTEDEPIVEAVFLRNTVGRAVCLECTIPEEPVAVSLLRAPREGPRKMYPNYPRLSHRTTLSKRPIPAVGNPHWYFHLER